MDEGEKKWLPGQESRFPTYTPVLNPRTGNFFAIPAIVIKKPKKPKQRRAAKAATKSTKARRKSTK